MALVPLVIDVSSYQLNVDYAKVKASGVVGNIIKASEGLRKDPVHDKHVADSRAAGLRVGHYHFFDFAATPQAQADFFLASANPAPDDLLCLDWENVPGGGEDSKAQAQAFLQRIFDKTGKRAVIYSGNVAKEQLGDKVDPFFAAHPLWLCQYADHFTTQATWANKPWLWQNNGDQSGPGPHTIPGVNGYCDNSTVVGDMTVERLLAEWSGAPPAPVVVAPPPAKVNSKVAGIGAVMIAVLAGLAGHFGVPSGQVAPPPQTQSAAPSSSGGSVALPTAVEPAPVAVPQPAPIPSPPVAPVAPAPTPRVVKVAPRAFPTQPPSPPVSCALVRFWDPLLTDAEKRALAEASHYTPAQIAEAKRCLEK
jgi:GH25 family lysozyme M1 (1,4-beta-N-acetylmuramidase)